MCDWVDEFPGMISVCDTEGKILMMNQEIADYFASSGGKKLIGTNLFDCHGDNSAMQIRGLMETQKTDVYIAEEGGGRELVIHVPWYRAGVFAGLVEISVPIEGEIRVISRE